MWLHSSYLKQKNGININQKVSAANKIALHLSMPFYSEDKNHSSNTISQWLFCMGRVYIIMTYQGDSKERKSASRTCCIHAEN